MTGNGQGSSGSFCPYVGLRPFTEKHQKYFHGRKKSCNIITSNFYASRLTVLYGPSGVGKSSVLMAGVIPQLRQEKAVVIFYKEWQQRDFLARLKLECLTAAKRFSDRVPELSLELPLDELLLELGRAAECKLLLMLDQFEEYFVYHPEGAAETEEFEPQFARAVNREEVNTNFLLALREDSLHMLHRFNPRIPHLLEHTLFLQRLDRKEAEEAIRKPLEVYNEQFPENGVTIEPELVETILNELEDSGDLPPTVAGGAPAKSPIETPLLQLVMERLWHEELKEESRTLRFSTLTRLGNLRDIVRTHLNDVMAELSPEQQKLCARFFDRLVTPSCTKIACRLDDLTNWAGNLSELVPGVLQLFTARRILRSVPPPLFKHNAECYEIFHDILGPAIIRWHKQYMKQRALERAQAEVNELLERAQDEKRRAEGQAALAGRLRVAAGALTMFSVALFGITLYAHGNGRCPFCGK